MNQATQDFVPLVDTHAHLDDERLCADLEDVLKSAELAGVGQIITMGTTGPTSATAVKLAQTHRGLFAAVGIHPNDAAEAGQRDWPVITDLVNNAGGRRHRRDGAGSLLEPDAVPRTTRVVRPPSPLGPRARPSHRYSQP